MSKLNSRSANRISFHLDQVEKRQLLLQKYAVGSAGYERTLNAIEKDYAIINEVRAKLGQREIKASERAAFLASMPPKVPGKRGPKGPVGPRKGEFFSIELGDDLVGYSSNDNTSDLEVAV